MAKKEEEKETKSLTEKTSTKGTKKETSKKDKKKNDKVKKENYFVGVKQEMAKVKWPSKKDVGKYTLATIIFIVVLVAFFILMSMLMALIKGGI